ncbi:peptidyl-tRNA hydrolase [Annulohypoxylon maeteangense]|uniref:peptidyl-tRNA hydrolase n=1 Tax=Annulohypoxylon maeteangense TaxID=1927788 RepID=UPI0020088EC9|nr:peptidyl-tRNA hydrolase [Annulohypoxylon maeteangense]KAI0884115.1 peptidyl-tRNA hydrolase [Annulohypoxylon maeteangense]
MAGEIFNPRFLIVSLGNQAPYYDCLHSAGHFALASLQRLLGPSQPSFTPERYGGQKCLASTDYKYTLVQSPTQMNVSGPWFAKTWREMLQRHQLQPANLSLVLVHDDLEEEPGRVRIRDWKASHRGHNGIKDINRVIKPASFNGARWSRISVGIGRPVHRDQNAVSSYVLRKLNRSERDMMEEEVGPSVLECLHKLEEKWAAEHTKTLS